MGSIGRDPRLKEGWRTVLEYDIVLIALTVRDMPVRYILMCIVQDIIGCWVITKLGT